MTFRQLNIKAGMNQNGSHLEYQCFEIYALFINVLTIQVMESQERDPNKRFKYLFMIFHLLYMLKMISKLDFF